jgi:hypothetical protein
MSNRKRATGRKSATAKRLPTESAPQPDEQVPIDGALVQVMVGEEGEGRRVQALGTTKVVELPTLLRLAANDVERQLGVD